MSSPLVRALLNADAPALIVHIPLEGRAKIVFDTRSVEDEYRLRGWLRRTQLLDELAAIATRLLDDLDEIDQAA